MTASVPAAPVAPSSIGARLTRTVLAVGLLAALVTSALLLGQIYLQERDAARDRLEDFERTSVPALTVALWTVDPQAAEPLLDGIADRTSVVFVALESSEGERWTRGAPDASAWLQRRFELIHVDGKRYPVGHLDVQIGDAHVLQRMLEQLPLIALIVFAAMLSAAWLIARQFRRRVARPLEDLSRFARGLTGDALRTPIELKGRHADTAGDEIDQLVGALNEARSRMLSDLEQRAAQTEELRRHQLHLEQLVSQRTGDLSERLRQLAQANAELDAASRRAEELTGRLTDFAEISADGFWETDAELRLTLVSETFARMMGTEVGRMLGKTPAEAYRARFPKAPDLGTYMAPLRARQAFDQQRIQMRDANGQRRWVLNQGRPVFDAGGAFRGYRGTVTDITARVEAESALKASEERLRTITDSVPALISYIDADRVFRFNNQVYAEWMRKPLEEITGRRVDEVYDAETYRLIEPHLQAAFTGARTSFDIDLQGRVYRATYVPHSASDGTVLGIYGLIHDITRLKRIEQELRDAATVDALTGLPNRRHFGDLLGEAISRSERSGKAMALMFLDLDRFKQVNDTLGHEAGDSLLKELAARLRRSVRVTDTAARLAGDEFVVILEGLGVAEEAATVADKILAAAGEPMLLGDAEYRMSISIGIAVRRPGERDGEALLRRADTALYAAKAAGRGCFRFAERAAAGATG